MGKQEKPCHERFHQKLKVVSLVLFVIYFSCFPAVASYAHSVLVKNTGIVLLVLSPCQSIKAGVGLPSTPIYVEH